GFFWGFDFFGKRCFTQGLFAELGPYPYWKGKASVDWVPLRVHKGIFASHGIFLFNMDFYLGSSLANSHEAQCYKDVTLLSFLRSNTSLPFSAARANNLRGIES